MKCTFDKYPHTHIILPVADSNGNRSDGNPAGTDGGSADSDPADTYTD